MYEIHAGRMAPNASMVCILMNHAKREDNFYLYANRAYGAILVEILELVPQAPPLVLSRDFPLGYLELRVGNTAEVIGRIDQLPIPAFEDEEQVCLRSHKPQ